MVNITELLMDLVVAIVAVIIGAYILNLMGYLTHKSPVNMYSGVAPTTQLMQEAGTGGQSQSLNRATDETFGQTALPPGSAGSEQSSFGRAGVV